jgi:hypothetical protein
MFTPSTPDRARANNASRTQSADAKVSLTPAFPPHATEFISSIRSASPRRCAILTYRVSPLASPREADGLIMFAIVG